MNRLHFKSTHLVAALLTAGLIGGVGVSAVRDMAVAHAQPTVAAQAVAPATVTTPDFASIAARQGAAVVNISTSGTTTPPIPSRLQPMGISEQGNWTQPHCFTVQHYFFSCEDTQIHTLQEAISNTNTQMEKKLHKHKQ